MGWVAGLASLVLVACAMTPERLPNLDRRFYYNLPSPQQQQTFLELPESERQPFLETHGLWQQWTALPEEQREAAKQGEVRVGFAEFAMFMAWGPPADTQDRDREGKPATIHTYIRCSSGPKRGQYVRSNLDCDGTSDETQVMVVDGVVTEINYAT